MYDVATVGFDEGIEGRGDGQRECFGEQGH